jgi:hypothetical protein
MIPPSVFLKNGTAKTPREEREKEQTKKIALLLGSSLSFLLVLFLASLASWRFFLERVLAVFS